MKQLRRNKLRKKMKKRKRKKRRIKEKQKHCLSLGWSVRRDHQENDFYMALILIHLF
jgi:hypothetical protein